jgi:hypothetical protein
MAASSDDTKAKVTSAATPATSTQASKDGAEANERARKDRLDAEQNPVDQQALGLSKHLTSWRESYGDDVVDAALALSAQQRKATEKEGSDGEKADAARARAAAGQERSAAPSGRTASDPKSTATA